jgi:hypothetical protein
MKKIFVLISITSLFFACIKEDPITISNFSIFNQSTNKITVISYSNKNVMYDSMLIKPNENFVISENLEEGLRFQLGEMNRAIILFNDTVFYTVYRDSLSKLPSGNILKLEDWSGGKIDEYHYEYEFSFTEADYLEALKHQ